MMSSLLGGTACFGAINFTVTTDTKSLMGHPAGPFSLDFQFTDGAGTIDGNNSITLSAFAFGGGSWGGPSSITLDDTAAFFSEYYHEFTPGTYLKFNVSMTTVVDSGSTPDQFSFAILDNSVAEIPTFGLGDSFVSVDINSLTPLIQSFKSNSSDPSINIDAPAIGAVPEPSTYLVGLYTLGMMGLFVWKHRN